MRYKMTYILFLFFLLTTIPYIITIYINKENKKNISFENYDSCLLYTSDAADE